MTFRNPEIWLAQLSQAHGLRKTKIWTFPHSLFHLSLLPPPPPTHQWYQPSQLPSHPIIGEPSSGFEQWGQYQTSPPGLIATPGNFSGGNSPALPERGVVCFHDDDDVAPGSADSSSLGSFIWGMFDPPFFPAFWGLRERKRACNELL